MPSDAAIVTIVTGVVTISTLVVGYFRLKFEAATKAKVVEDKIDSNTELTKAGTHAAAANAQVAAEAATDAAKISDNLAKLIDGQLNGALDERISIIVKAYVDPLRAIVEANSKSLLNFVSNAELQKFAEYVHQRNHDMLNALDAQNKQVALFSKRLEKAGVIPPLPPDQ